MWMPLAIRKNALYATSRDLNIEKITPRMPGSTIESTIPEYAIMP